MTIEKRSALAGGSLDMLTSTEAAKVLGVSSANTVKNWLEGGAFPGATRTPGGHWRFPRKDVEELKTRMAWVQAKNAKADVELPDLDDGADPPLL